MTEMHLYTANCTGNEKNCRYPNAVTIRSEESLRAAVAKDHVCAKYKNDYRSTENLECADCVMLDNDNDHSDNPEDWITPENLLEEFTDVDIGITESRHNNLPKEDKGPRPRNHVYFRCRKYTDPEAYAALKKVIQERYPFFDGNALDAGRFVYGSRSDHVIWHEGGKTIEEFLEEQAEAEEKAEEIPAGRRNATMSHFAGRVLKRFGDSEKAKRSYLERAENCTPPLSDEELEKIWNSARRFFYKKVAADPTYVSPQEYNNPNPGWPEPLPFSKFTLTQFPVDALPSAIAEYVKAVAESTQTSVDMAGTIAISILSTCLQKKYRVQGKPDWTEPVNTYAIVIAPPSERKSSVLHMMIQPVNTYEVQYNREHAASVEAGKMQRRILERRQKAIEDKMAKGTAEANELEQIAKEIAEYKEEKPLQMYVDDITTEKLVSIISSNGGYASLISSEGGIFDTIAGIYTKNVNIDVMLKGYSGDTIRVDRIGRESESIMDPALTVLLMAQPSVVSKVLGNATFRGRGLTARFLYSMPNSIVGERKYRSSVCTPEIYQKYEGLVVNMLQDEYAEKPEIITLSPEADQMLEDFANWLEPELKGDYWEIADWAGKLVGNVLRISGLLCRAGRFVDHDFLRVADPFVVSGETMKNAIRLGKYYLNHAQAAYSVLPEDTMYNNANMILQKIQEMKLTSFNRRDAMRMCRTFKTVESIQPSLDFLEDYGYIAQKPQKPTGTGRPPLPRYAVNPWVLEHYRSGN